MSKYVVIDLEMCNVPKMLKSKKYHYGSEIIQIGAVLLDDSLVIVDEFNTYVFPENGLIDDYIKRLTGINWEKVKSAPTLENALISFVNWLPDGDVQMVSWSDTDQTQIKHETEAKGISISRLDEVLDCWIDSQQIFDEILGTENNTSLSNALIIADIEYPMNNMALSNF